MILASTSDCNLDSSNAINNQLAEETRFSLEYEKILSRLTPGLCHSFIDSTHLEMTCVIMSHEIGWLCIIKVIIVIVIIVATSV